MRGRWAARGPIGPADDPASTAPLFAPRATLIMVQTDATSAVSEGAPTTMPAHKTILLVDDDTDIIESMRTVLEGKGYRILVARDGNAGLAVAERENPDLIVLDMMMPKKSGFLVLEKLKTRPGGLIPTVMITGNEGSRHRAYAEFLGVKDYIRKPFALEKLVRSIEKILGDKILSPEDDG